MGIAEIVALTSGIILLLVATVLLGMYIFYYMRTHSLIELTIGVVYIVVVVSIIALYTSLWFILPWYVMGIASLFIGIIFAEVVSEIIDE